jgi:hypothetical protein
MLLKKLLDQVFEDLSFVLSPETVHLLEKQSYSACLIIVYFNFTFRTKKTS